MELTLPVNDFFTITLENAAYLAVGACLGMVCCIIFIKLRQNSSFRAMDPVLKSLERYEQRLAVMEKDQERAYGTISERLVEMGKSQQYLSIETANLAKALRVPHVRGRWGEITLKRVAELAGMSEYCDFKEQVTIPAGNIKTGSGKKGQVRPDMVVTLPENRHIIIDAKVPLMAYLDALEADTDAQKQACMRHHGQQVLKHISNLASKNYFIHLTPSPEFVVLFIPGENFFSAALTYHPDLIEKGIEKGVVLATPTTLIALLKAVLYAWKQKKSYENAEEIRKLGVELFSRLATMTDHINRLGKDIEKSAASFNRTVGSLEKRVMPSARRLGDMGVSSRTLAPLKEIKHEDSRVQTIDDPANDHE